MKLIKIIPILFALTIILTTTNTSAHENHLYDIKYEQDTPWGPMLQFKGSFVAGLSEAFINALAAHPDTKIISMNSPGGLLSEAYKVGTLFSNWNVDVWVPRNAACISACALAFLGGVEYHVSGLLAFHAPWLPQYDGEMKLQDIYSQGQSTGAWQSYYFAANGFRAQLYQMIAQYTNRDTFIMFVNTWDLEYFLMKPERTYTEYLEQKVVPPTVMQGNGELIQAIMRRKTLEVLRNMGEFNYQGGGARLPSYIELKKRHQSGPMQ